MNNVNLQSLFYNVLSFNLLQSEIRTGQAVRIFQYYRMLQISIVFILFALGYKVLHAKTSKVQIANIILIMCSLFMMIGYILEQDTLSLEVMCAAVKIEYFAQCGVMISILWLMDLICENKINKVLYYTQYAVWAILLFGIFNFEKGTFFYTSYGIEYIGSHAMLHLKPGPLYVICYTSNILVLARYEVLCYGKMKKSNGIDQKRCYWMLLGPVFPIFFTVLKWTGISRGFDLMAFGLLGFIYCFTQAIIRYNFLESIRSDNEVDQLTGLNNRYYFEKQIDVLLKNRTNGALYMLDMDNFKYANDNFGHGMGDKILRLFGETLTELSDSNFLSTRLGGDEFCLYVMDQTSTKKFEEIANHIRNRFHEKQLQEKLPCHVSCSIGICVYPGTYDETFEKLYEKADKALYLAKNSGKSQNRLYH